MDDTLREELLEVARLTEDRLVAKEVTPEAKAGIIMMLIHANGGGMEEDLLAVTTAVLDAAAKVAGITGRQPVYEFVADVLVEVGK